MNPDVTLNEVRDLLVSLDDAYRRDLGTRRLAEKVMSQFVALDRWLSEGGSLPDGWNRFR